jgi:hypothetical protein
MTTIREPFSRASSMNGHRCRLVSRVLVAHRMMRLECRSSLGSSALPVPFVAEVPALGGIIHEYEHAAWPARMRFSARLHGHQRLECDARHIRGPEQD